MYYTIAEKIKAVREEKQLSQSRFGSKIGVSGKTVSAYERGKVKPTLSIINKISEVFNVVLLELPKNKRDRLVNKMQDMETSMQEIRELLNISLD